MGDTNLDKMKAMHARLAIRGRGKYTPPANAKSDAKRGAGGVGSAPAPAVKAPAADASENREATPKSSSDE
jgi:hypothetical protein